MIREDNRKFAKITAFIVCLLFLVVILRDGNNMTFVRSFNDQANLCYPQFVKLGELVSKGIFSGVDIATSNGATEFFSRCNLTTMYPIAIMFAYIGHISSLEYPLYMLMVLIHLFVAIYYTQRLAYKFFGISKYYALLAAVSSLPLYAAEMVYEGFVLSSMLVIPIIYSSLSYIESENKSLYLLHICPIVMGLTTGYIMISAFLAGWTFLFSLIYIMNKYKGEIKKRIIKMIFLYAGAGIVCFAYYLQLSLYQTNYVQSGMNSLEEVLGLSLNLSNIPSIIFSSYIPTNLIAQYKIIYIGTIWLMAIAYIILGIKNKKQFQPLSLFCIIITIAIMIVCFGDATPLAVLFYKFVPIFGKMHLPIRYLMIIMPTFYLMMTWLLESNTENGEIKTKRNIILAIIIFILMIGIYIKFKQQMKTNIAFLEILTTLICIISILKTGWRSKQTIIIWTINILIVGLNMFNGNFTRDISVLKPHNIAYNDNDIEILDNYIRKYESKDLIKYICIDRSEILHPYIKYNYPWMRGDLNLSNYYGYELHLALPKDYVSINNYFDIINWDYAEDTRFDFGIFSDDYVAENLEILDKVIDWNSSSEVLSNGIKIYSFKKFIPSYYTGTQAIEETAENVMDNGYFYSPTLSNKNMLNFDTNKSTYFKVTVETKEDSQIMFLPYANPYYKYYVDEEQIEPIIYNMTSIINIPQGIHVIKIVYSNMLSKVAYHILLGYYIIFIIYGIYISGKNLKRKNN